MYVEPPTSRTNPVLLEPVQQKQPETTTPSSDDNQTKKAEPEDEIKPNPFGFELPVLRSVSATQLPPPIVRQEPELVLPTLKPVPEKISNEPSDIVNDASSLQWELPPLDSRPNLQALLEREKRAAEAAVNNEAFKQQQEEQQRKQEEQQRKQQQEELLRKQEELRRKQEEQQRAMRQQVEQQKQQQLRQQQQMVMNEQLRAVQEAQMAKLSVRLKVQRFESSGPPLLIGLAATSQGGSPRPSSMQSPPALTGRNKPLGMPMAALKSPEIRFNTKENAAPPLPVSTPIIPRMAESFHPPEPAPAPAMMAATVVYHPPTPIQHRQQLPETLEPLPMVQLRQTSK